MSTNLDCQTTITCLSRALTERRTAQLALSIIRSVLLLLLLVVTLVGCSGEDRKVVLSDETGSRTLVYEYGKGFIPQARVPEDVPVLIHSMQTTMADALKENDILTAKALQTAVKEHDFRTIERTVVEFRFRQIQKAAK